MKKLEKLDLLPEDQNMRAGIDMTCCVSQVLQFADTYPGCLFLLCMR